MNEIELAIRELEKATRAINRLFNIEDTHEGESEGDDE